MLRLQAAIAGARAHLCGEFFLTLALLQAGLLRHLRLHLRELVILTLMVMAAVAPVFLKFSDLYVQTPRDPNQWRPKPTETAWIRNAERNLSEFPRGRIQVRCGMPPI